MNNLNKFRKSTVAILTAMLLISIAMPLLVGTVGAATATISLGLTSSGPCGTAATVTGSGFTANLAAGTLTVTFNGVAMTWTSGGGTDLNGAIATNSKFTVPSSLAPAQYLVVVSDAAGNTATATFTVNPPVVNISPASGKTGSAVYVSASGFLGSSAITATVNGVGVTLSGTSAASATGTITSTFTVPAVPFTTTYPTTVTVTLTDAAGNVGTATYTMGAPAITVAPASAAVGSTVTVSGSGFASGATVTIAYGATPTTITTATATSAGTFTADITVPAGLTKGAVAIVAYETAATSTNRAATTLTVIPKATINMGYGFASLSGTNTVPKTQASTTITISGTGFAPTSAITLSWSPVTPSNTFTTANLVTDANGVLAAAAGTTSTAAALATEGTYTLTMTDAAGNQATAQLVVKSSGTYWTISPATGPVGTTVTATYFGGANTNTGVITVGGVTASATSVAAAAAYPTSATKTFVIPSLSAGTYAVSGTGDWTAYAGQATFKVTTAAPSVTLSTTTAAKGQVVGITGSGFIPGSTCTVTILGNPQGTITASATGTITGTLTVPAFAIGSYDVQVMDTSYNTAVATISIAAPAVTLSATSIQLTGILGATRILFNGTGFFGSGSAFTITLGGSACTVQTALMDRPNGFGVAYGSFTVPSGLVAGAQTLVITDASGNSYSTTITVQPTIALSPSAVPAGNVVTVSGSAFAASSTLSLKLDGTLLQLYTGTTAGATTTGAGAIPGSVTFTVPANTAGGAHTITVSDYAAVNNTQTATLTVTSPTLTLSPSTGASGITVTVSGTGWLPGVTTGTITFGTTSVSSTLATGSVAPNVGKITGGNTFTVPQVAAGNYTVTVSDGVESLTATFTVTTAAIALSAPSGNVGDVIVITGTGFNPQTINLGVTTILTFGSTSITTLATGYSTPVVYANGTLGCTNTVTNTPVMGIPIVVPSSVAGANTVTMAFSAPALTSSQTFTVQPKITSTTTGILKGTQITVSGTGFAATSALTATLGGQTVTLTSGATTIAAGTTTAQFYVPVTAATGANTLVITDAAGHSASMSLTIGTPSIASLSVTSGPAGTSVQVTGTGFFVTTGNQIFISFDGLTLATNPTTVATSTGSFIAFITVPTSATVGAHTIAATDSNNNQATADFNVTSGSTGSALPDTITMQNTAKTTTPSGTATTSFTAGSTVKAGFTLQTASGSRSVVVAVTFQQGAKVYNMASQTATMSTTPTEISFSNLIPAGATGTWTAQLQVFAADGVTALAVQTLTFTVA